MSFPDADSGMTDRLVGEIDAILAQHAEAEGERGEALTPLRLAILQLNGWAKVAAEDGREHTAENYRRVIAALRTAEAQHRAALSAVTAERDRLLQEKGDPAGSFEKCMQAMRDRDEHAKTIDQLRAEVDGLRKDAERYQWLRSVGGRSYSDTKTGEKATGEIYDSCIGAAMAAKEA